ncbi:TetR/AcrR family transcriptional regulator [Acanthopleuribacter pedis]|uniref:TetR/AcrR family transcriptional regulator n=1 Tax=Acanthopleuribacter pedis TaxID=442870 RepID=A0A8J7U7C9_9BACT|nr:TetR/AcrR family transcriptional regulator [Acanthopleuribacter pedis]MBO1322378.1 TetR/AcrR family transcriptional regulator [Acanthopleuribacter pedis]
MGRPKNFDEEQVLEKALQLFWSRGFFSCSMQELVAMMGINRFSLYSAFGSKEGLFNQCMRRYCQRGKRLMFQPLSRPDAGLAELHGFFTRLAEVAGSEKGERGCFMNNSLAELDLLNPEAQAIVNRWYADMRTVFLKALQRGGAEGALAAEIDCEALADFLVGTVMGVWSMARTDLPAAHIKRYVETAMAQLPQPA